MAKFECYKDMLSFNRTLMEDDYNDGQLYTVKLKNKANGVANDTTAKVGEAKDGSHKLALENKVKGTVSEIGGFDFEVKYKNSGDADFQSTWHFLNKIEGLENLNAKWEMTANTAKGLTNHKMGLELENDTVKTKVMLTVDKNPTFNNESAVRTPWGFTFGTKNTLLVTDPLKAHSGEVSVAGHFEKAVQWGMLYKHAYAGTYAPKACSLYFNHENNGNVAGGEFAYDYASKTFDSKLGVKLTQEDHTWKFRVHGDGLMRAALQWQMHKAVKTTLTTSVNLKDVPAGKVSGIPLGWNFEVKY